MQQDGDRRHYRLDIDSLGHAARRPRLCPPTGWLADAVPSDASQARTSFYFIKVCRPEPPARRPALRPARVGGHIVRRVTDACRLPSYGILQRTS